MLGNIVLLVWDGSGKNIGKPLKTVEYIIGILCWLRAFADVFRTAVVKGNKRRASMQKLKLNQSYQTKIER